MPYCLQQPHFVVCLQISVSGRCLLTWQRPDVNADITEEASSTLELLFGYQQPKESTFVVDGLDYCSSGDDTYSAFADACTEDIALSAEREAGAEGSWNAAAPI